MRREPATEWKSKVAASLQPAVPQQMRIYRAVMHREVQPRHHQVFQLFSHVYRVELSVFHVHCPLVGQTFLSVL